MPVESIAQLREIYALPRDRAVRKQLSSLDRHCRRFIETSPFLVLSTSDADGRLDASPRGGPVGFVRIIDDSTLLIPDSPGNNRLDSLQNIIHTGRVGLLFLIPGVDETLRINGRADISCEPEDLQRCMPDGRRGAITAIRVEIEEAYLHCPKAFMRSRLWDPDARVSRQVLPTLNEMIHEQTGDDSPVESQQEMLQRYQKDL